MWISIESGCNQLLVKMFLPNSDNTHDDEVNCKVHVGIPRMDLDTEKTYETDNLYIESTHGSLKNIINLSFL